SRATGVPLRALRTDRSRGARGDASNIAIHQRVARSGHSLRASDRRVRATRLSGKPEERPEPATRTRPATPKTQTSSAQPTLDLTPLEEAEVLGHRVGPYELIVELGRGGMGSVWLARRADDQYQKDVAIKLIKGGFDSQLILERFRAERQILA